MDHRVRNVGCRYVRCFEQRPREISLALLKCKMLTGHEKTEGVCQGRRAELADMIRRLWHVSSIELKELDCSNVVLTRQPAAHPASILLARLRRFLSTSGAWPSWRRPNLRRRWPVRARKLIGVMPRMRPKVCATDEQTARSREHCNGNAIS
jgi:hypothetical protein